VAVPVLSNNYGQVAETPMLTSSIIPCHTSHASQT